MTDRIPLDAMTSNQLDALYDRAEQAETRITQTEELLSVAHETSNRSETERVRAVHRAELTEAAVERARQLASRWAVLRAYGGAATELRAALGEQPGARDRHVAEEHTKEIPMPTTPCTATIEGVTVPDDETLTCTVEDVDHHPANHVGPKRQYGRVLWTDHTAGATPHKEQS
ncbi:hypothetical protein ACIRF8_12715 [Streptomyces sp. NPDC102406]|uniref:hypothetical protein n=1 Tax=Streptomyces sp. NPDC102406 TaxID=3366171 RepID=UPI003812E93C